MFVALAAGGKLYIWARVYAENWSAFAPDFKVGRRGGVACVCVGVFGVE
jgi:hypothetical protein